MFKLKPNKQDLKDHKKTIIKDVSRQKPCPELFREVLQNEQTLTYVINELVERADLYDISENYVKEVIEYVVYLASELLEAEGKSNP